MKTYSRKDFIRLSTLASMCFFMPPPLMARKKTDCTTSDSKLQTTGTFIVDMHTHPSLKYVLFNKKIWRRHLFASRGQNDLSAQMDFSRINKGNLKGIVAKHYLPERGILEQAVKLKGAFRWLKVIADRAANAFEMGDSGNFRQICSIMDNFEEQIRRANEKSVMQYGINICITRSYKEFEKCIRGNNVAVAHAIEGAHAIGRDLKTEQDYLDNIEFLAKRGVCIITLSHFFPNDLAFPCEGIDPVAKHRDMGLFWEYNPAYDDKPLTPIGKKAVEAMLDLGIVVDVTHLTPQGRKDVFELNNNRERLGKLKRPIIFSHTGARALFNTPKRYENYKYYLASNPEIKMIQECNGVIGVLFENYFLTGMELGLKKEREKENNVSIPRKTLKNAIDNILLTIDHIHAITGCYDNIALGSDFDGFTDAPSDLKNPSYYPTLVHAMKCKLGLDDETIAKITHGNAMRVLKEGWTYNS